MSRWQRVGIVIVFLCTGVGQLCAQSDDLGLWASAEVKKKIFPGLDASLEGEFRLRDNMRTIDRWGGTAGLSYKLFSFLKASAGYTYIYYNHPDKTTKKENYIPEYGSPRHRVSVALTGSYKWNRFEFSLRERYQYTYRVGLSVPKYNLEEQIRKENEEIPAKSVHVLRSRLQVEYDIRKSPFKPYTSCEWYHSLNGEGFKKIRWTLGTSYKLNKKNTFDLCYRYQNEADEDEADGHVIGVGYSFKF